jgi:hypothetical protein
MISTASVEDNKWIQWRPDVFQDIFKRRVYKQLPPKHEALSLLKDYFENFNCMFPLFHEPTFMHLVDKHYSKDPYEGSGWWASLNVALAFAHRLRVMSNLVPAEEDEKAWQYLKNAMSVMVELTMRNTDLLSVQALLGVVSKTWESFEIARLMSCRASSCWEHPTRNQPTSSLPLQCDWRTALASTRRVPTSASTPPKLNSEGVFSGLHICSTKSRWSLVPRVDYANSLQVSVCDLADLLYKTTMT